MRRLLLMLLIFTLTSCAFASQIKRLQFSELEGKSKYILLAYVEEIVRSDESSDTIRIRVVSVLKGKSHTPGFMQITLRNKGLKDFDPKLESGDQGVFFLSKINGTTGQLAYWGSIATFPKKCNFDTADNRINTDQQ